jgi:plastocyanin
MPPIERVGGMKTRLKLVTAAAGALLLLPAAAQAATKDVYAGTPPRGALEGVRGPALDNAFYPKRIAVHAGDHVRFNILGFHNVLFAPKGTETPALVAPNPQAPVSGATDAAGNPMWFNGQPSIGLNPQVVAPVGGKAIDGSELVGSGLPTEDGPPKPFKVRFPKKGNYTLVCSVHPGMKVTVQVKNRNARIASARQDARRIRKQANAAAKLAKRLVAGKGVPGGNTIRAGNDKAGIATIAFFPGEKTVKVGDTVTWDLSPRTTEIHNIAFAPEDYAKNLARSFIGPQGLDPMTAYPSEAPGTPLVFDATNHGNGYLNTGILDPMDEFPDEASITFTKPGTYTYYCIVHGAEMKGTITVTS